MSDYIYPLALIGGEFSVENYSRVITDTYESGTESRRAMWPANHLRRQFAINHGGLTDAEMATLMEFHGDRTAAKDDFWFRDSVHRTGNHKVRFGDGFRPVISRMNRAIEVKLTETSSRRALPSLPEVTAAAFGVAPTLWLDPNRESVVTHMGAETYEKGPWDVVSRKRSGTWTGTGARFTGLNEAYSRYAFNGTTGNALGPIPPGWSGRRSTLFVIARADETYSHQIVFSLGRGGGYHGVGLCLFSGNEWGPWLGSSTTHITCRRGNTPANVWHSFLIHYNTDGGNVALFADGAASGLAFPGTWDRSDPIGYGLGSAPEGDLLSAVDVGTAIFYPDRMADPYATAAQLHNLFAYQYGMTPV